MNSLSAYPIFCRNMTALKNTSKDDRDKKNIVYMTESMREAVCFDRVKDNYIETLKLSDTPKSNDALMEIETGKFVFVEFKNGYMNKAEQFGLRKKIYDSVLIFSDITAQGISAMRECVEYILVYNEEANKDNPDVEEKRAHVQASSSFDEIAKNIAGYAREEYVCFGIKIFENYCFSKVHTYTKEEFEQYLSSLDSSR